MKKLFIIFILLFSISYLNASNLKFGTGKEYEGTFYTRVFNVSVLNYYDNGTKTLHSYPVLNFLIVVNSENFNPYAAHCYMKINDNFTKKLNFFFNSANVPPGYMNKYIFDNKIVPQEFGYEFNYEGFENLLNSIDNVTFYLEYEGDTYITSINNFSQYVDFLKTYNNSIVDFNTSNYPEIFANIDTNYNVSDIGLCLLVGRYDIWNNPDYSAGSKIDYGRKALFGEWVSIDNLTGNSFNLADVPGIVIPVLPGYIAKLKTEIRANMDENSEGYGILRFQIAYKRVLPENIIPITNVSSWQLFGSGGPMGRDLYIQQINKIFNLDKVKTVWSWKNSKWYIWSPDETLMNLILNYGLPKLNIVYHFNGFWVNFK